MLNRSDDSLIRMFRTHIAAEFAVSTITVAELEFGVANSVRLEQNHRKLIEFLSPLSLVSFDQFDARVYAKIKNGLRIKGKPIDPFDMLIAAQAINRNLILLTNDSHFSRIPDLRIENWIKKK